jgi:hypothetical protein
MKTPIDILRDKYFTTGKLNESDFTESDINFERLIKESYHNGELNALVYNKSITLQEYYNQKFEI